MASGGNDFNNFHENQLTKFQLEEERYDPAYICRAISIQFVHGRKTAHLAFREDLGRDA